MADAVSDHKNQVAPAVSTAKARYEFLKTERDPFLNRARECAAVTVPYLMPPEGSDGSTELPTPFQSVGSRGVTNLTAKLLLVLFPPGSACFRLDIARKLLDQMDEDAKAEFNTALSKVENEVRNKMEQKGTRTQINESLEQLVVSGNFLLQVLPDGALKGHRLDRYVVKRDLSGNVVEIIVVEPLSRKTAPENVQRLIASSMTEQQDTTGKDRVDVFTWIRRDPSKRFWKIHQEVCDKVIEESRSSQPLDKSAWLPLRWTSIAGEDYGRGYCEKHLGDLQSADRLNRAILDFSAAASKILFLVDGGGTTSRKKIAQARNLDVIEGQAKDVTTLQMDKFGDFKVTLETLARVEKRLEQAFLLLSGSQRNAERVTAEEIRLLAQELESALGGVYSVLAQELQRPLVVRYMAQMQRSGELPPLPEKAVSPQIVTGIAGLGRSSDLQRLDAYLMGIQEIFGQEAVVEAISLSEYAKRRAAALSIDAAGLVRTEEQIAQGRAQKQQAALAEKAVPESMKMAAAQSAQPSKEGATQ